MERRAKSAFGPHRMRPHTGAAAAQLDSTHDRVPPKTGGTRSMSTGQHPEGRGCGWPWDAATHHVWVELCFGIYEISDMTRGAGKPSELGKRPWGIQEGPWLHPRGGAPEGRPGTRPRGAPEDAPGGGARGRARGRARGARGPPPYIMILVMGEGVGGVPEGGAGGALFCTFRATFQTTLQDHFAGLLFMLGGLAGGGWEDGTLRAKIINRK